MKAQAGGQAAALAVPDAAPTSAAVDVFVGRHQEMLLLRRMLGASREGRGGLALIVGGAGIGKTRAAEELCSVALSCGSRVLWGRCWEGEGAPAYWPWLQVIRAYARDQDAAALIAELGPGAPRIAQLVPELGRRLGITNAGPALRSREGRFRLFDDVATFLKAAAKARPMLIVLDDLQWADEASLLLLQLLARELRTVPLLVVCTYRDADFARQRPATEALGWLARNGTRVILRGLDRNDVGQVIEHVAGFSPTAALTRNVHEETGGNPFFVREVVHMLLDEGGLQPGEEAQGSEIAVPGAIREVVASRLGHLSVTCKSVLEVASAAGQEFDRRVIARVTGLTQERLATTLDEAIDEGMLQRLPDSPARYRFSHALIRRAVHEAITPERRLVLHRDIGAAIEEIHPADPDSRLTELSYHFYEAAAGSKQAAAKALDHAVRAAERATSRLAYEDAAVHYQRAVRAFELCSDDEEQRCRLLLALGEALSETGQVRRARLVYRRAGNSAREVGSAEMLARAALGFAGKRLGTEVRVDEAVTGLLDEALAAVGDQDSGLRAELLARLARALYFSAEPDAAERRVRLSEEGLAMAQRVGDTRAEIAALSSRYWAPWRSGDAEQRLELVTTMTELATLTGDRETLLQGRQQRVDELVALGRLAEADAEAQPLAELASELGHPTYLYVSALYLAMRALLDGRFAEGERLAAEAQAIGERGAIASPAHVLWYQTSWLDGILGRLSAEATMARARDRARRYPSLQTRARLAVAYSELGWADRSRDEFEALASQGFRDLPDDHRRLPAIAAVSVACAALRDAGSAKVLYRMLSPYAGQGVVARPSILYEGPVDHYLGILAGAMDRWPEASAHLEKAVEISSRMGALAHEAQTEYEAARALLFSGRKDERTVWHHLDRAIGIAERLGMQPLCQKAAMLRDGGERTGLLLAGGGLSRRPAQGTTTMEGRGGSELSVFRKEGPFWTVVFAGDLIRVKDVRGVRYLAQLLARPGRELHSAELAAMTASSPSANGAGRGAHDHSDRLHTELGDSGEILDAEARAQYKRRIHDLRDDLEEAEGFNDTVRATELRTELDFITDQLAAALGLGGRARKMGDINERARKAVSNRIRATIMQMAEEHPLLGQHLGEYIKTGTYCSYRPEHPVRWRL